MGFDDLYKNQRRLLVVFTMKIGFYTLGCKVNQYETQAMEQLLIAKGHEIGAFNESCDGYIINTCSVTAVADKKNRGIIRRCRKANPSSVIGVCGCYSQHAPEAVKALGVDVIGGSSQREAFLDAVISAVETREAKELLDHALQRRQFEILPAGGLEGRTRAMLKVQDGCCNFCSYCIIPYTRGPVRSAPIDLAVKQAKDLEAQGYREIVITGIEISSWGVDLPGKPALYTLIQAICQAVPDLRIRLGSLEPRIITQEFCDTLKQYPNLCPHFHLSLQSGSDSVLARMKRKYTTSEYYDKITLLSRTFPACAITTDLIVAFPGETEEEFQETLNFIKKCAFADMHIFPYSRRPGTPADKMPQQHSNAEKERRCNEAIIIAKELRDNFLNSEKNTTHIALFEKEEKGYFIGHTSNYIKLYIKGDNLHNQIRQVVLLNRFCDGMICKFI